MQIAFTKMNGAGNDFILIDNRDETIQLEAEQIVQLCHRQRGIGADGLLLLEPNKSQSADWSWKFYNSDGGTAEMCGNGARCFAAFVKQLIGCEDSLSFETLAGVINASFENDLVTVTLTPPENLELEQDLKLNGETLTSHSLNTGVPHAVVFVEDADRAMVQEQGQAIRQHPHFAPSGTNVNFVQILKPGLIRVRTYERGIEGETLACGTGVSAAAMITSRIQDTTPPISVQVQGGDLLTVDFQDSESESGFKNVKLTGPASFVFTGEISI